MLAGKDHLILLVMTSLVVSQNLKRVTNSIARRYVLGGGKGSTHLGRAIF